MEEKKIQQMPNLPPQSEQPAMIIEGPDGKRHKVNMAAVMNNLKAHNAKLSEENAVLKALLQEKGVYL